MDLQFDNPGLNEIAIVVLGLIIRFLERRKLKK